MNRMGGADRRDHDEGPLARRLLEVRVPGRERVVTGALARYRQTGRRHAGRRWLLMAAAVVVTAGVVAATPAAQAISGPAAAALRMAGIGPRAAVDVQVPLAHGQPLQATSSGHTVTLTGAYGDATHTVVFLRFEPGWMAGSMTLVDESGVPFGGGSTGGSSHGDSEATYAPLPPGQHRLTLRMTSINRFLSDAHPGFDTVHGTWSFTFTLRVSPDRLTARPRTGTVSGVAVTIDAVSGDGYSLDASIETVGATIDELTETPNETQVTPGVPVPTPVDPFQVQVLDAQGRPMTVVNESNGVAGKSGTGLRDVNWQVYLAGGHGPGTYRLVVTYRGQRMESTVTIP